MRVPVDTEAKKKLEDSGYKTCPACGRFDYPVQSLWESGQFGPQCPGCQTKLGLASTPPMPAAMVRNDRYQPVANPVGWEAEEAEPTAPSAKPGVRPAVSRGQPRGPKTSLVERDDRTGPADDLTILKDRLAVVLEESAELRVLVYRLRGLEAEEKHLRREVTRVESVRTKAGRVPVDALLTNGFPGPHITTKN